jgi:tricarballylate dehydrogenase
MASRCRRIFHQIGAAAYRVEAPRMAGSGSTQHLHLERQPFDVAVVGGGNAGMCAALAAAGDGARVVVLETAPKEFRAGNSRHTRNLRCAHESPSALLTGTYREEEFLADLLRVTDGDTDEPLARLLVRLSADCPAWMQRHGVRLQPALSGTLHLDRTNAFFLGGGKALMNSYYVAAARAGVTVCYDAEVLDIGIESGRFRAAHAKIGGIPCTIGAKAVVLAAGGFESNLEWLAEIWGDAARHFIVRGTRYNRGTVLKTMLERGAVPVGEASQCHAIAVDARAPKFDGGIVTRLDSIPLGIVVNRHGRRFYDEGEDFWPRRYAIWGRLIAQQDDQIAWSIVDTQSLGLFMPSVFPPITAPSIAALASATNIPTASLEETIDLFNRAVRPGSFNHGALDDCHTEGLMPEKTHWARRIDTPPFLAWPLRPGITFTYLGLKVNREARVLMNGGIPAPNIFAAGEIMAGNILRKGYAAGTGMTIGTVFGWIAGREAARHASG